MKTQLELLAAMVKQSEASISKVRLQQSLLCFSAFLHLIKITDLSNSLILATPAPLSKSVFALITRASLECWARAIFIKEFPNRFHELELESLLSETQIYEQFDVIETFYKDGEEMRYFKETQQRIAELTKEGTPRIKIHQIFSAINAINEYKMLYKYLCQSPHSSLFSLIGDYFRPIQSSSQPGFILYSKPTQLELS